MQFESRHSAFSGSSSPTISLLWASAGGFLVVMCSSASTRTELAVLLIHGDLGFGAMRNWLVRNEKPDASGTWRAGSGGELPEKTVACASSDLG